MLSLFCCSRPSMGRKILLEFELQRYFKFMGLPRYPVLASKWPMSCSSQEAGVLMAGVENGRGEREPQVASACSSSSCEPKLSRRPTVGMGEPIKTFKLSLPPPEKFCVSKHPHFSFWHWPQVPAFISSSNEIKLHFWGVTPCGLDATLSVFLNCVAGIIFNYPWW